MQILKAQSEKALPFWMLRDKVSIETDIRNEPLESHLHRIQDEEEDARIAEEWIEAQEAFVYDFLCYECGVDSDLKQSNDLKPINPICLPQ